MGEAYPELRENKSHIENTLLQEENQFAATLELGLNLLQEHMQSLGGKEIGGEIAFKLYDTYGFPIDLTADIAKEQGLRVDMEGFNQRMQNQRAQSQAASSFNIDYSLQAQLAHQSEFHGYEKERITASIKALIQEGREVISLQQGIKGGVILDNTPFYAESGGQVGDEGILQGQTFRFRVLDTQKHGRAIVHFGEVLEGTLRLDDTLEAIINKEKRDAIRLNHTATHLLHAALKKILGSKVQQKGSLVDSHRARFDFSYNLSLTSHQVQALEDLVNEQIRVNKAVETHLMGIESAKHSGALALFGEKYSDTVRVLSIGEFSKELCGGTHAFRTGDIGLFKILNESGIASGIRRIEFLTGKTALDFVHEQSKRLEAVAALLKTKVNQVEEKLAELLLDHKKMEKELIKRQAEKAHLSGSALLSEVEHLHDIQLLIKEVHGMDNQTMRATLDQLKSSLKAPVIVLYVLDKDKLNVMAGLNKQSLEKAPNAAFIVRHLCGKGGGRDDMAQGGGDIPSDFKQRLSDLRQMIVNHNT